MGNTVTTILPQGAFKSCHGAGARCDWAGEFSSDRDVRLFGGSAVSLSVCLAENGHGCPRLSQVRVRQIRGEANSVPGETKCSSVPWDWSGPFGKLNRFNPTKKQKQHEFQFMAAAKSFWCFRFGGTFNCS
ncbi:unnamed protein product [Effrenium voratum]|nr:unnamed protein product [Effrenium voratum]